jgi:hypothetical protein
MENTQGRLQNPVIREITRPEGIQTISKLAWRGEVARDKYPAFYSNV